jgi:hypothetical protein
VQNAQFFKALTGKKPDRQAAFRQKIAFASRLPKARPPMSTKKPCFNDHCHPCQQPVLQTATDCPRRLGTLSKNCLGIFGTLNIGLPLISRSCCCCPNLAPGRQFHLRSQNPSAEFYFQPHSIRAQRQAPFDILRSHSI